MKAAKVATLRALSNAKTTKHFLSSSILSSSVSKQLLHQSRACSTKSTNCNCSDAQHSHEWAALFCRLRRYRNASQIIQTLLTYTSKFGLQPAGICHYEENIQFLIQHRIGPQYIGMCLEKCPLLFYLDRAADLEPKIEEFRKAGVTEPTIQHLLRNYLNLLTYKTSTLQIKLEYLANLGLGAEELDAALYGFPALISLSVEDRLKPLVAELQSLGFNGGSLARTVASCPQVFSMRAGGELSRYVGLLQNLKCRPDLKDRILSNGGIIAQSRRAKSRVECLVRQGLCYRDAFQVLRREPRIIMYSPHSLQQRLHFLVQEMGYPVTGLLQVPEFLGVHFHKQLVARHRVFEHLRASGALSGNVPLKTLVSLTRNQFLNRYVRPYPECEAIFRQHSQPWAQ